MLRRLILSCLVAALTQALTLHAQTTTTTTTASTTADPFDPNPPILITEQGDHFALTVSRSDITMRLPKADLRREQALRVGATASRRYFHFAGSNVMVSGWFEGAARFTDLRKRWQTEMEGLARTGLPAPTEVEDFEAGMLKGILYTLPTPQGSSSHVRATYLSPGTWVDLHLSVTADVPAADSRAQVLAVARSITFAPKPPSMGTYFAPRVRRSLAVLTSDLKRGPSCPIFALAAVPDANGALRDIEFGEPVERAGRDAKAKILTVAAMAATTLKAQSVLTAYCEPPQGEDQPAVSGHIVLHFDHRDGFSSGERVPFERANDGSLRLLPQRPGQALNLYGSRPAAAPASQAASAAQQ